MLGAYCPIQLLPAASTLSLLHDLSLRAQPLARKIVLELYRMATMKHMKRC